jgi:hypothetical protein
MKFILYMLVTAIAALGANIGDTYEQVISEKGKPKSEMDAGTLRLLNYPDVVIKIKDDVVVTIKAVPAAAPAPAPAQSAAPAGPTPAPEIGAQIAIWKKKLDAAVASAVEIINQPVPSVPKPQGKRLVTGYFHDGATRPMFNLVDIRATQEGMFDAEEYIAWQGQPDLMWVGKDTEFNAMTKYFYVDRSLPKKKLTEDEMVEVNRLYRIIAQCEDQLHRLGFAGKVP